MAKIFSERLLCFCCPKSHKPGRSVAPINPLVVQPMSRMRSKKRSDLSEFFFVLFIRKICLVALSSVLIIQSWFRRRKALLEMRRKAAWIIYQNIEYAGEQDQLKVKENLRLKKQNENENEFFSCTIFSWI